MNYETLKIKFNCAGCMFFEPDEDPDETKGTCHARPPTDDTFPEVNSVTGWCGEHQAGTVEAIVPNVTGLLVPDAIAAISAVVVLPSEITRVPGEPSNTVIGQNPVWGTRVNPNTIVNLTATNE